MRMRMIHQETLTAEEWIAMGRTMATELIEMDQPLDGLVAMASCAVGALPLDKLDSILDEDERIALGDLLKTINNLQTLSLHSECVTADGGSASNEEQEYVPKENHHDLMYG